MRQRGSNVPPPILVTTQLRKPPHNSRKISIFHIILSALDFKLHRLSMICNSHYPPGPCSKPFPTPAALARLGTLPTTADSVDLAPPLRKGPIASRCRELQAHHEVPRCTRFAIDHPGARAQVSDQGTDVQAFVGRERPSGDYAGAVQADIFGDALLRGRAHFERGKVHGHAERRARFESIRFVGHTREPSAWTATPGREDRRKPYFITRRQQSGRYFSRHSTPWTRASCPPPRSAGHDSWRSRRARVTALRECAGSPRLEMGVVERHGK